MDPLASVAASVLSSTGISGLMLWYIATKWIPRMEERQDKHLKEKDDQLLKVILDGRKERIAFLAATQKISANMSRDLKESQALCERRHAEARQDHEAVKLGMERGHQTIIQQLESGQTKMAHELSRVESQIAVNRHEFRNVVNSFAGELIREFVPQNGGPVPKMPEAGGAGT